MTHEVETMAYAGAVPWHGLGTEISNDLNPVQMMQAAGLDWRVDMTANHYPPDHAHKAGQPVPDSHFIERTSDGAILGEKVVGTQYKLFQNEELFEFFAPFIDDGSMFLHTAGSLFGGRKVWCMATTKEGFTLGKDDQVNNNLLFTIAHTGLHANSALLTPIRVVCNNTMRLALDNSNEIVTHNHKVPFDAEVMKVALGISSENFGRFEEAAKAMAQKVLDSDEEIEFFKYVFGGKQKVVDNNVVQQSVGVRKAMAAFRGQQFATKPRKVETKAELAEGKADALATIEDMIASLRAGNTPDFRAIEAKRHDIDEDIAEVDAIINPGHNMESAKGSLWGAYQAVMWITDHAPVRQLKDDGSQRLDNALYGPQSGSDHKAKAYTKALELVAA